jgi:spore coat protein U-like protein
MTKTSDKYNETTIRDPRLAKAARAIMLAVLLLLFAMDTAWAARNCRLTVTGISFGTYRPGQATPVNANGNVHVRCQGKPRASQPTFYLLSLSAGNSGNFSARHMQKAPGKFLTYNVYTDPLYAMIWGDGSPGTSMVQQTFPGKKIDADHPAYGRVDASQDPEPGYYSDNLVVTLTF